MTALTLLTSLFKYKASIDDELLDAVKRLDENPQDAKFKSALRILHHAHLVDVIFVANLERKAHAVKANWHNEAPDLDDLAADIRRTDRWYLDYMLRITADELEESIDFTFTDGGNGRMSREEMLAHVITHSGYHRGEVAGLLPDLESTSMRDVFTGYLHKAEPERRNQG